MIMNIKPKNAMDEKGCECCLWRCDPTGKGWCQFWSKKMRSKFPCWKFEAEIPDLDKIFENNP